MDSDRDRDRDRDRDSDNKYVSSFILKFIAVNARNLEEFCLPTRIPLPDRIHDSLIGHYRIMELAN